MRLIAYGVLCCVVRIDVKCANIVLRVASYVACNVMSRRYIVVLVCRCVVALFCAGVYAVV